MGIRTLKARETNCPGPLVDLASYLPEITYFRANLGSVFTILNANFIKLNPKIDDKDVNVFEHFLETLKMQIVDVF